MDTIDTIKGDNKTSKETLRRYLEDARNSEGYKPQIAIMGFGTWAEFACEFDADPLDKRPYLDLDGTFFFADPYMQEGIVAFPAFDQPWPSAEPKFVVRNGLSYLDI